MEKFFDGVHWVGSLCAQVFVMVGLPLGIYLTIKRMIRREVKGELEKERTKKGPP